MVFDVNVAVNWILFLALFPIAFFWLRRASRIFVRRDYSEVALKGGESPANPEKFAPYVGVLNLLGGLVVVATIIGVVLGQLAYESWSALAGIVIWCKFFADFIISRHAHPFLARKKTLPAANGDQPGSAAP